MLIISIWRIKVVGKGERKPVAVMVHQEWGITEAANDNKMIWLRLPMPIAKELAGERSMQGVVVNKMIWLWNMRRPMPITEKHNNNNLAWERSMQEEARKGGLFFSISPNAPYLPP